MATKYTVESRTQGVLESVTNVDFTRSYSTKSTTADIEMISRTEANSLSLNESLTIKDENSTIVWGGVIVDIPVPDGGKVTVRGKSSYENVFNFNANGRVFFREDSGDVMRKLIEEKININDTETINNATSDTDWTSDAPNFELCDFRSLKISDYGGDLLYVGLPKNTEGTISNKLSNVSIDGDEYIQLILNLFINNPNGTYEFQIEFRDGDGQNYVWDLGAIDGKREVKLDLSDANTEPTELSTNNTIDIRTKIKGKTVDDVAYAIDAVRAQTGDIFTRSIPFDSVDIPKTGNKVTRRPKGNVGTTIRALSEENRGNVIVTTDNVAKYKVRQSEQSDIDINSNTPKFSYDKSKNVTEIVNRVIVEGDGFTEALEETNSINFYDGKTNTERIRDPDIKTRDDARNKARQILREKAFRSTRLDVVLPPRSFTDDIEVGDSIRVDLDEIAGNFVVQEINVDNQGRITVGIIAREDRIE